jgi:hypothetical protein
MERIWETADLRAHARLTFPGTGLLPPRALDRWSATKSLIAQGCSRGNVPGDGHAWALHASERKSRALVTIDSVQSVAVVHCKTLRVRFTRRLARISLAFKYRLLAHLAARF